MGVNALTSTGTTNIASNPNAAASDPMQLIPKLVAQLMEKLGQGGNAKTGAATKASGAGGSGEAEGGSGDIASLIKKVLENCAKLDPAQMAKLVQQVPGLSDLVKAATGQGTSSGGVPMNNLTAGGARTF